MITGMVFQMNPVEEVISIFWSLNKTEKNSVRLEMPLLLQEGNSAHHSDFAS